MKKIYFLIYSQLNSILKEILNTSEVRVVCRKGAFSRGSQKSVSKVGAKWALTPKEPGQNGPMKAMVDRILFIPENCIMFCIKQAWKTPTIDFFF